MYAGAATRTFQCAQGGNGARGAAVHGVPMYVALVDVCGGEEYVELIRSALQAALEAMPAGALFGLITFSTRVSGATEWSSAVVLETARPQQRPSCNQVTATPFQLALLHSGPRDAGADSMNRSASSPQSRCR